MLARLGAAARRLAPRLTAWLLVMRKRLEESLDALLSRLARDLPERPDGKTIAVAAVALILVFGVSASVLGSRGPRSAAPSLAAPSELALERAGRGGVPTAAPPRPRWRGPARLTRPTGRCRRWSSPPSATGPRHHR